MRISARLALTLATLLPAAAGGLDAQPVPASERIAPAEALRLRLPAGAAGGISTPVIQGGAEESARQEQGDTLGVSPGGAFFRALLVPGWGHAAVGAYGRGAFYFLTAGATGWMLAKTGHFVGAAEDRRRLVRRQVVTELARRGIDPDTAQALIDEDERVQAAEDLVEVRSQQMEDWTAFGVFWLFLNAADAFVSAHLRDFPEPIDVDAAVTGEPGRAGARIRVSVPLGRR